MNKKYYPVADRPDFNNKYKARHTGKFRAPRRGEYYLSGAIPEAYRAPNDLTSAYWIMKLVRVEVKTIEVIREV
jgi:hypothetical protein